MDEHTVGILSGREGSGKYPELEQLQALLDQLREALWCDAQPKDIDTLDPATLGRIVTAVIKSRRRRERYFGGELFGEPAWEILLELYAAEQADEKLSVSGACHVSGAPGTTALRYVNRLQKDGWIRRDQDSLDGRRCWLRLTEQGLSAMQNYLHEVFTSSALAQAPLFKICEKVPETTNR